MVRNRPFAGRPPWGPREAFIAFAVGISLFFLSSVLVVVAVAALDYELVLEDPPDIFHTAGVIAEYADERLRAAARGDALPLPPAITPEVGALRIALGSTVVFQLATIGVVLAITRRSPGELIALFRLDEFEMRQMTRPAILTVIAYMGVVAYAVMVETLGLDILVPESTVPSAVAQDTITLALAGLAAVIMAPISEELMYRGLIMGGLLKWGFLPAALISSVMFSAVHLDIGSLIPFFGVGMILAYLYWSGGRLWDAILFHFFFNLISYLILAGTGG